MTDTAMRTADLKDMLSERRREIQDEVQSRIRDGCAGRPIEVRDDLEHADAGRQGAMRQLLALPRMWQFLILCWPITRLQRRLRPFQRSCGAARPALARARFAPSQLRTWR